MDVMTSISLNYKQKLKKQKLQKKNPMDSKFIFLFENR